MPNSDLEGFRRAVQLRDRCREAAVAAGLRLGLPVSPVQANVAFDAMVDLIREHDREALRAELASAVTLIRDLADPDPCSFDHHGGCQAHGYLSLDPGQKCPQAEAKELLIKHFTDNRPKETPGGAQ